MPRLMIILITLVLVVVPYAKADEPIPSQSPEGPPHQRNGHIMRPPAENPETAVQLEQHPGPGEFPREMPRRNRRGPDLGPELVVSPDQMPEARPGDPRGSRRMQRPELTEQDRENFIAWLTANYPEQAVRFKEMFKDGLPTTEQRGGGMWIREYIAIYLASKQNPGMAEILMKDLPLRRQRDDLVRAIRGTKDAAKKLELAAELRLVVRQRFDLLVQQKQFEYDMLLERLRKMEEQITENKKRLDELKENADQHIDGQMQRMLEPRPWPVPPPPPQE